MKKFIIIFILYQVQLLSQEIKIFLRLKYIINYILKLRIMKVFGKDKIYLILPLYLNVILNLMKLLLIPLVELRIFFRSIKSYRRKK